MHSYEIHLHYFLRRVKADPGTTLFVLASEVTHKCATDKDAFKLKNK